VIPSLREWYQTFSERGLVVIGNHYPEFAYEKELENLRDAIHRLGIAYPVIQDNEGVNWKAYNIHYWPTLILIDKVGQIRFRHVGEGSYQEIESAIDTLLNEAVEKE
jgi:hypothetical protein